MTKWDGPGSVGHSQQRTFGAAGAAAAAGAFFVTVTNVPKNLTLEVLGLGVTAALPLPFVVAVPVAFFLIEIEPGGRPAPGLRPPKRFALPTWPVKKAPRIGAQRVTPKKDVGHSDVYKERDVAHQMRI